MASRKKNTPQSSLFAGQVQAPLAERLRPHQLEEVIGQEHLTGAGGVLARMVAAR